MVLIANNDGTIASVTPSTITQGSNLVQSIYLICPVSNYTAVDVVFILPTSSTINGGVMLPSIPTTLNETLVNTFSYKLTTSVTNFPGKVDVVFKCYDTTGEILATYTSSFMVEKTTKPILPEEPDVDVYEQLLTAFAYVNGKLETGELEAKGIMPYDAEFSYQQGAMTYLKNDDVVDSYISLVADNLGNALTDTDSWYKVSDFYKKTEADAKFLQKDFTVLTERTYLQLVDFIALRSENATYKTSLDTLRAYLTQGLVGLTFQIVEELPETGIGNVIYMVPYITTKESYPSIVDFPEIGEADTRYIAEDTELTYLWEDEEYKEYDAGYIEYIWIEENNKYENIGLSKIQLGEYAKISWVNDTFIKFTDIVDNLTTDDATKPLSANMGKALNDSKINTIDIVNNLTTDDDTKPLSAKQGKILQDNKVDKETGKGLSTNDLTNELKESYDNHIINTLNPHSVTKAQVGLGNVYNPTAYGGISYGGGAGESGISFTNLNSLTYSGFYTCYGTTANVPSASYSWFIQHINSNVGNASATQIATAYGTANIIYKRNKVGDTWGDWENISPSLKAELDASNLTAENVESWQDVCNFERVETVYDKNSGDSNINWGYTSGIGNGTTVSSKDFSKYKRLIITSSFSSQEVGSNGVILLDLTAVNYSNSYVASNSTGSYTADVLYIENAFITVNTAKTSITVTFNRCYPTSTQLNSTPKIIKILGVY